MWRTARDAHTHTHTSTHKYTTCKNLCVRNKLYNPTEQADVYIWRPVQKILCIVLRTTYLKLYEICKNYVHIAIFFGGQFIVMWRRVRRRVNGDVSNALWCFETLTITHSDSDTYAKNVTLHKICYLILWEKCSSELRKMGCRH